MSIRTMSRVWECSQLGGTELLLMLAIADFANDDGTAFPSVSTLAAKIRMSERNTHYLLRKIERSGELSIERNAGPKGCNLFRVQTLQGAELARVQPIAPGGATGSAKGVQPIAPEPSLNRQEPSCPKNPDAKPILQYLNDRANRSYRPVKANLSLIAARLKEGATADECRKVIDAKVAEWADDSKMRRYLRPETLFNATKFAQYVGELDPQSAEGGEQWE